MTPQEQIVLLRAACRAGLRVLHQTGVSKKAVADQMRAALAASAVAHEGVAERCAACAEVVAATRHPASGQCPRCGHLHPWPTDEGCP